MFNDDYVIAVLGVAEGARASVTLGPQPVIEEAVSAGDTPLAITCRKRADSHLVRAVSRAAVVPGPCSLDCPPGG
jgi:hypothetical protein